jgi:hypothetical protein
MIRKTFPAVAWYLDEKSTTLEDFVSGIGILGLFFFGK